MNPRVLELLKNPKNIQSEDLNLLKEEIHAFPYVQNIRALHLYGVHLYDQENYQKELSITAAYTTDKKILYQLINGKIRPETQPVEQTEEKPAEKPAAKPARFGYKDKAFPLKRQETTEEQAKENKEETAACILNTPQEVTHIYVNGERNRILFEGEENFLNEEQAETIDLESTLESGTLVTQKTEFVSNPISLIQEPVQEKPDTDTAGEENTEFTPEEIVNQDQLSEAKEKEEVIQEDHLSFHEIDPLERVVNEETNPESTHTLSGEQKEEIAETEMGAELTPEEIISEEKPSEEITKEIEDHTGFHEIEPLIPDAEENENPAVEDIRSETSQDTSAEQEDPAEISFHGTDSFMPDVKIQPVNTEETAMAEIAQPAVNKHEEEMRRLIEEVEKKMKETKPAAEITEEEPEAEDHEISFAETQNFHFWSTGSDEPKLKEESGSEAVTENMVENGNPVTVPAEVPAEEPGEPEVAPEINTAWKPMSVDAHVPDSLIAKEVTSPEIKMEDVAQEPVQITEEKQEKIDEEITAESSVKETEAVQEEREEIAETAEKEDRETISEEQAPVMSVSFFGSDISSLSGGETKNETEKEKPVQNIEQEQPALDSNVPGFINTWQSWLKIDRTVEIEKEKTEIKEKAIETFIENNPRISQLKEESTYVVKERNDDISHLMTETLANLYLEQKLYSKAIKAFGILKKKHPEKAEYFDAKIKEVNDIKSGK